MRNHARWRCAAFRPEHPASQRAKIQFGGSVTGAYEGWFDNADGTHTFLVGYFSRNTNQAIDIPIGPNNRIEPGGPDMGQPTHFLPGRNVGMFTVTVPKEFTLQQRLTWTLVANGQTTSIPLRLHLDYNVSPFGEDAAVGNRPPIVKFNEKGPTFTGPIAAYAKPGATLTTAVSQPLALNVWADDDAKYSSGSSAPMRNPPPPVEVNWSKFRGPGSVTFDNASAEARGAEGRQGRGAVRRQGHRRRPGSASPASMACWPSSPTTPASAAAARSAAGRVDCESHRHEVTVSRTHWCYPGASAHLAEWGPFPCTGGRLCRSVR